MSDIITNTTNTNDCKVFKVYLSKYTATNISSSNLVINNSTVNGINVTNALNNLQNTKLDKGGYTKTAQDLKNDIDGIQIGGRNLAKNSNTDIGVLPLYGVTADYSIVDASNITKKIFKATNIVRTIGNYVFYVPFDNSPEKFSGNLSGIPITISFYIRTNNSQFLDVVNKTIDSNWKRVSFQYTWGGSGNLHFTLSGADLQWFEIHSLKIEKGNKATDWTPAPEDVEALINLEIQDVENKITGLETTVNTTFKDGIIEQAEAKAIEKYINTLNAEKSDIDNQYNTIYNDALLTGTAKDNLFSQKESYNTAHSQLLSSINTAIADGKTTPSEKSDVDSKFTNYKNVLGGLAIRLTEALKAIEAKRIDNVQIGGRNLFLESEAERNAIFPMNYNKLSETLIEGKEYNISFEIKGVNDGRFFLNPSLQFEIPVNPNANEWFKISKTFVYVKNDYLDRPIYPHIYGATVARKIKLEKGNKATDWTPAPEDVEAKISAEAQKIIALENKTDFLTGTTIEGNAVATGTLLVGNESGGNAGITGAGASGSSTRFYAGSNYAGRDYANWRMRDDGVEEQWTLWNGQRKIVRRRGQIGNKYQDILYNPEDGSIAKITTVVDGYVEEQWYKNGQIVYSVGSGGIYYVAEIAESWTTHSSKLLTSTASQTDAQLVTLLKNLLVFTEYKDAGYGDYATIEIDTPNPFYRYHAGKNVYSESNKQYEKYYFNQETSKTGTKLADGWYNIGFSVNTEDIPSGGGRANYNFTTNVFRILSGEVAESRTLTITGTYYIHP